MRVFIGAVVLSVVFPPAASAASGECDYAGALLSQLASPESLYCYSGKIEDRLDCLAQVVARQNQQIAVLKCELEQMRTAKVTPLRSTIGRAD